MLSSTFRRFSMLLLLAACCVVFSENIGENKKLKVAMNYIKDDWRPHFNYRPGHMASDHEKRKRARSTVRPPQVDTSKHLDPYLVRLMHRNKFLCSGIVFNVQEVLTPTHCLSKAHPTEIVVKLLDGTQHKGVGIANTTDITVQEASNLLVLLKLEKPLDKLYEKPPSICRLPVKFGAKVEVWNWDNSRQFIKKKIVPVIAEARCKQLWGDPEGAIVTSAVSCVENIKVTQKCEVTFGLPYVWRGSFCGINLLGHNCPNITQADVYVKLIRVKSFIAETLRQLVRSKLEDSLI